jgi:hypothetical protein
MIATSNVDRLDGGTVCALTRKPDGGAIIELRSETHIRRVHASFDDLPDDIALGDTLVFFGDAIDAHAAPSNENARPSSSGAPAEARAKPSMAVLEREPERAVEDRR